MTEKLHPLHTEEWIRNCQLSMPVSEWPFITRRRLGTSTAIALETLARAIRNPDTPIKVSDHFVGERLGYSERDHRRASEHTMHMALGFASALDLKHIHPVGTRSTAKWPTIIFENRDRDKEQPNDDSGQHDGVYLKVRRLLSRLRRQQWNLPCKRTSLRV